MIISINIVINLSVSFFYCSHALCQIIRINIVTYFYVVIVITIARVRIKFLLRSRFQMEREQRERERQQQVICLLWGCFSFHSQSNNSNNIELLT
jgi:hypothetical protein